MTQYVWHPEYAAAMLETIPDQKLIATAENAIHARLQDSLNGHAVSPIELQAVKYALDHLPRLKRELQALRPAS